MGNSGYNIYGCCDDFQHCHLSNDTRFEIKGVLPPDGEGENAWCVHTHNKEFSFKVSDPNFC